MASRTLLQQQRKISYLVCNVSDELISHFEINVKYQRTDHNIVCKTITPKLDG